MRLMPALRLALASGGALSRAFPIPSCSGRGVPIWSRSKALAGELSDPQQSVMAALASGGRVGVVRNAEEMLALLDAHVPHVVELSG